jgi:hypothetical protein
VLETEVEVLCPDMKKRMFIGRGRKHGVGSIIGSIPHLFEEGLKNRFLFLDIGRYIE